MNSRVVHRDGCMCDECIKERTRQRLAAAGADQVRKEYEGRRGGKIGSISVSDALKGRKL